MSPEQNWSTGQVCRLVGSARGHDPLILCLCDICRRRIRARLPDIAPPTTPASMRFRERYGALKDTSIQSTRCASLTVCIHFFVQFPHLGEAKLHRMRVIVLLPGGTSRRKSGRLWRCLVDTKPRNHPKALLLLS